MNEAARLRDLADQCRRLAATLHAEQTAETLREMASAFEASAETVDRLPMPTPGPSRRPR